MPWVTATTKDPRTSVCYLEFGSSRSGLWFTQLPHTQLLPSPAEQGPQSPSPAARAWGSLRATIPSGLTCSCCCQGRLTFRARRMENATHRKAGRGGSALGRPGAALEQAAQEETFQEGREGTGLHAQEGRVGRGLEDGKGGIPDRDQGPPQTLPKSWKCPQRPTVG